MPEFPTLPIITPPAPRLTLREKYGNLYYLGIAGLVVTALILVRFGFGAYQTRHYWAAIWRLNDPGRPEAVRVEAAWLVSHHPSEGDAHRHANALRTDLPPLARYIAAEALTADAIRADPKAYALEVAKSEGWPDWLRLVLIRPMAYAAGDGYTIPWEPLDRLRERSDPAIVLWATYTRAAMSPADPAALAALDQAAHRDGPFRDLADLLLTAARTEGGARSSRLDDATAWLRDHHPEVSTLWKGWREEQGTLRPIP